MKKHIGAFLAGVGTSLGVAFGVYHWLTKTSKFESRATKRLIDLNTASMDDLMQLRGVDREMAKRIVENRPYRNKLDLVNRMVIPEATYTEITARIRVDLHSAAEPVKVAG